MADSVHKSVNLVVFEVVLPESVRGVEWKRPVGDNGYSGSKREVTLDDIESEVAEYFKKCKSLDWIKQYPKITVDDCF